MQTSLGARRVRVSVPATSANLGPGFDAIGVALDLRGEVELSVAGAPFYDPDRGQQMALAAVSAVFRGLGRAAPDVAVAFRSEVPVARGLGASAIVRTGAALAAFAIAGVHPEPDRVLHLVTELEGHADNAAPALLGGLQVVAVEPEQIWHIAVPLPSSLSAAVLIPEFEMSTDESRQLLPSALPRADAVHNAARAALLIAALATGRLDALRVATDDRLHQPARAKLFPAMYDIFQAATEAGALCAFLSGGGSSILAMVRGDGQHVAAAMENAARSAGVAASSRVVGLGGRGAEILEVE
jgi:homoserine kinase